MSLPEQNMIGNEWHGGDVYEQAETALCIWEFVMECRVEDKTKRPVDGSGVYEWITQEQGAYHGRSNAIKLAWLVERAYQVGNGQNEEYALDGLAFDWEIVPYIISTWVELFDSPEDITVEIADQLGETLPEALKQENPNE